MCRNGIYRAVEHMQALPMVSTLLPGIPPLAAKLAGHALGFPRLQSLYDSLRMEDSERPLPERLLKYLRISYQVSSTDREKIPAAGPAILVANHPFGLLDGAILAHLVQEIRPDVRILANGMLQQVSELRHLIIPVDPESCARGKHGAQLRQAFRHLSNGGLLIVFPAGEVSSFQWEARGVTDPPWSIAVARLARLAARSGSPPLIVPVFTSGRNSLLFQFAGLAYPPLRTALLPHELLNKTAKEVRVSIGSPIVPAKILATADDHELTAYLRWRTYLLAQRQPYKPLVRLPLRSPKACVAHAPIACAVSPKAMADEVTALDSNARLASSGDLSVYLARASQIPAILREIGRLRELTFRAAGEGTGRPSDSDIFDAHYLHLFLWNSRKQEIVGAYRLCATDAQGGLYTATLFYYDERFLDKLGPALELGRSFIRSEYQRAFTPLLLLWRGIGKYVAANPRYKVLFGPVSISSQYHLMSRDLMVSYLQAHASLAGWKDLLHPKHPPKLRDENGMPPPCRDIDELSQVVGDIEPTSAGVPVLLRQYLRLGGKLLSFNVDPEFSNALDGLIVVDLTRTEPKLLQRYLGAAEALTFLAHHGA